MGRYMSWEGALRPPLLCWGVEVQRVWLYKCGGQGRSILDLCANTHFCAEMVYCYRPLRTSLERLPRRIDAFLSRR